MTEKIEITREMLREALVKVMKTHGDWGADLERELFGPKKPREFTLFRYSKSDPWYELMPKQRMHEAWETMRVREENEGRISALWKLVHVRHVRVWRRS